MHVNFLSFLHIISNCRRIPECSFQREELKHTQKKFSSFTLNWRKFNWIYDIEYENNNVPVSLFRRNFSYSSWRNYDRKWSEHNDNDLRFIRRRHDNRLTMQKMICDYCVRRAKYARFDELKIFSYSQAVACRIRTEIGDLCKINLYFATFCGNWVLILEVLSTKLMMWTFWDYRHSGKEKSIFNINYSHVILHKKHVFCLNIIF